jgi:GNAT superfamily N-acetyltransferase
MGSDPMTIHELRSDDEITAACPLMLQLRERLHAGTFLQEVRRQQAQGYELIGAFADGRLVALAGVRRTHTLSRGEHLFIDDLVTDTAVQGRGYGSALMRWIAVRAAAEGIPCLHLDSRITARGFYERLGFTFHTSIPCWLEVSNYLAEATTTL